MSKNLALGLLVVVGFLMPSLKAGSLAWGEKINEINNFRLTISASSSSKQEDAFNGLVQYTKDKNTVVRADASAALGAIAKVLSHSDSQIAVRVLVDGLNDQAQEVRRECAKALGEFRTETEIAVNPLLRVAASERGTDVSLFAIQSLGKIGQQSTEIVPALIKMAQDSADDSSRVRWEGLPAVRALSSFNDQSAEIVQALTRLLNSSNPELLAALVRTIATLDPTNRNLDIAVERLLGQPNLQWRIAALKAVENLKPISAKETELLEDLAKNDANPAVRLLAARILKTGVN